MVLETQQKTVGVFHQFIASLADKSQDIVQMKSETLSGDDSSRNNLKKEENIDK